MELLTRIEELLLLTVWKLQEEAYGLEIRRYLSQLLGEDLSVGAVYVPLKRLKKRGYLESWEGEPTAQRGGRSKRFYKLTSKGVSALVKIRGVSNEAWSNLPDLGFDLPFTT